MSSYRGVLNLEKEVPEAKVCSNLILARGALFASLSRIVPIPFLDDLLLRQTNRHMLSSLLKLHGLDVDIHSFSPLYEQSFGCFVYVLSLPFRVFMRIIKKIFKMIFIIFAIHEAVSQIVETVLYGRTIERCLMDGRICVPDLVEDGSMRMALDSSRRCREVFSKVISGNDWRFAREAFSGVLGNFKNYKKLGRKVRMFLFRNKKTSSTLEEDFNSMDQMSQNQIEKFTSKIADFLASPEIEAYLIDFDQRYDEAWLSYNPEGR